MKDILTAEEFIVLYNSKPQKDSLMVAFAKLHVEAALKSVANEVENETEKDFITKETVLLAYSLENIK